MPRELTLYEINRNVESYANQHLKDVVRAKCYLYWNSLPGIRFLHYVEHHAIAME